MTSEVKVLITGQDATGAAIGSVQTKLGGLAGIAKSTGMAFTEFNAILNTGKMAFQTVESVVNQTVGAYADYAEQVKDMSRITGDSVEETSRMIQVADDLTISYESMMTAMQAATRKGIDTSVEGMAKLADEYLKLPEGLARAKFLMDSFGRSGSEMATMMEKGSQGIRDMAGAVEDGLIMTDQAVQQARDYKLAIDALDDSITALKYSAGSWAAPGMAAMADWWAKLFSGKTMNADDAAELINNFFGIATHEIEMQTPRTFGALENSLNNSIDKTKDLTKSTYMTDEAFKQLEDDTKSAIGAYENAYKAAQKAQEDFNKSMSEQTSGAAGKWFNTEGEQYHQLLKVQDEMFGTSKAKEWEQTQAINDATRKLYSETYGVINQEAMKNNPIYKMTDGEYLLDANGNRIEELQFFKTPEGFDKALSEYKSTISDIAVQYAPEAQTQVDLMYEKAKKLYDQLLLVGTEWNIDVTVTWNENGDFSLSNLAEYSQKGGYPTGHYNEQGNWIKDATGGQYVIPPGYYENYPVGGGHLASSGEIVTIASANGNIKDKATVIKVFGNLIVQPNEKGHLDAASILAQVK